MTSMQMLNRNLKIHNLKKQKGVALIVAMMVVALISAITIELSWRFELSASRTSNRLHGVQASSYLVGAENLAKIALKADAKDNQIDHLKETWAVQSAPFPTDEGYVQGTLVDAASRFNLNLLAPEPPKPGGNGAPRPNIDPFASPIKRFTTSQKRFVRLLRTFQFDEESELQQIDEAMAVQIVDAIIDWVDADSNPTGYGGAESDYYEALEPPFKISNAPFASVTELAIIKGITPQIYQKLLPLVIAVGKDTKMNVNTMPVNMVQTLNVETSLDPLTLEDAQEAIDVRAQQEEGFEDVQAFIDASTVLSSLVGQQNGTGSGNNNANGGQQTGLSTDDLSVSSNTFLFFSETMVGDHIKRSKTILTRDDGTVVVARRTDANF